jgi:hypothetical protein
MKTFLLIFFSLLFLVACSKKSKDGNDYKTGYETGYQSGANRVCKRFKATLADSDWDYHAPKECKQN